jgi:N-acetylglucosamine kinase-like BadF-type ATPase
LAGTAQSKAEGKMKRLLEEEFPGKPVRVCMDLELILAAVGEGAAVVLIAGTGSGAVGRAAGRMARVGGRGPLLSDEGSAYDIGRRASMLAIQEFDRTGANSALGERILRELNCATWQEFQNRAIALPDEVLPRVFPVAAAAADEGDSAAQRLLQNAASDLSSLVASLMEKLGLESQQFLLLSSGGMLGRSKFFDQQLVARLRNVAPLAEFGALAITPAESAARLALQLLQPQQREGN